MIVVFAAVGELNDMNLCLRPDEFQQLYRPCKEELLRSADSEPNHDRVGEPKHLRICKQVAIEGPVVVAGCDGIPVCFPELCPLFNGSKWWQWGARAVTAGPRAIEMGHQMTHVDAKPLLVVLGCAPEF